MTHQIDDPTIEALRERFRKELSLATTPDALKDLKDAFLGRKSGALTQALKGLATLAPEARRAVGQQLNALKSEIESALDDKRAAVEAARAPLAQ